MTDIEITHQPHQLLVTGELEGWAPFDDIRYDIEMNTLRAMFVMLCQVFCPSKSDMERISEEIKQYGEIYRREERMPTALADVMQLKLKLARGGLSFLMATDMAGDERLRKVFARHLLTVAETTETA